jgi:hypothetical protein
MPKKSKMYPGFKWQRKKGIDIMSALFQKFSDSHVEERKQV